MPRNPHKQRCSVNTGDHPHNRRPCRAWAVPHSDPPRCNMHAARPRRCPALTARATPCRIKPLPGLPHCHLHAAGTHPPPPRKRRCTATVRRRPDPSRPDLRPRRCRAWALHDGDPPLCRVHARGGRWRPPGPADRARDRQCTARTLSGSRCARWALTRRPPSQDPPLCWLHAHPRSHGRIRHSYYRRVPYFTPAQRAALVALARHDQRPLAAELALVRLKLHFLLNYLNRQTLTPRARLSATRLVFRAVRAVSRLLRARQQLAAANWTPVSLHGAGALLNHIKDETP